MRKRAIGLVVLSVCLTACEQQPLTAEQKKQGHCRSVAQAAKAIMLDRQQGIPLQQAIEHAKKIPDLTTRNQMLQFVEQAYATDLADNLDAKEQMMLAFQSDAYQACMVK